MSKSDHAPGNHARGSRNDVPNNVKTTAISLLNARLADAIDLALAVKQAHWNLRGRRFIAVHEMLDVLRGELDGFIDTMAERVSQLGGVALGTLQAAGASTLPAYPTGISKIDDHLRALADRTGQLANQVRAAIDAAADAGDAGTADIFTEVSRGLDKQLWFLEAHLDA